MLYDLALSVAARTPIPVDGSWGAIWDAQWQRKQIRKAVAKMLGVWQTEGHAHWRDRMRQEPCSYCGKADGLTGSIDHIVPKSMAGGLHWDNLTGACRSCNQRRGTMSPLLFFLRRRSTRDGIMREDLSRYRRVYAEQKRQNTPAN